MSHRDTEGQEQVCQMGAWWERGSLSGHRLAQSPAQGRPSPAFLFHQLHSSEPATSSDRGFLFSKIIKHYVFSEPLLVL